MSWLLQLDGNILLWIQENVRNDFLTPIFKVITSLGNSGWFWIAVLLILCIPKKTRWVGLTGLLAIIIGAIVTNLCLKNWVGRIRPYEVVEGLQRLIERQKDTSFPSGHSCVSFASAMAIYLSLPQALSAKLQGKSAGNADVTGTQSPDCGNVSARWGRCIGIAALVLATLIAVSRLYVGVHYPSDVIVGSLVGCLAGWSAFHLLEKLRSKRK